MTTYHLQNRPDREITSRTELDQLLKNGKFVTISMCRGDEPYIVTLSYGYDSQLDTLYFHSAKKGLKNDFIQSNSLVCATVIEDGGYIPDECAHNYRSVVFWGEMSVVNDAVEKKHGMGILLNHLEQNPSVIKKLFLKSEEAYSRMEVLKLRIIQIRGKAGK
jgi:nitroimidazol reductase NimA-like FMN-containing flavoprotein (pyridoxamine 5'-phosphate oxidase superfamily)